MYKKQTSVSHSSTESGIISLNAGLRMDGLPALDLWDVVVEVLRSTSSTKSPTNPASGNGCETGNCVRNTPKLGQERETKRIVFQIQKKSRYTRRDSRRDAGRSSALETKRSGMEVAIANLRENGIPLLHRRCNDSRKQVTQFSLVPVP